MFGMNFWRALSVKQLGRVAACGSVGRRRIGVNACPFNLPTIGVWVVSVGVLSASCLHSWVLQDG